MKILYLSNSRLSNSVNRVYIRGLEENKVDVSGHYIEKGLSGVIKAWRIIKSNRDYDLVIAGYESPWLVAVAKLGSSKPVIYNALCSIYERLIVARALASRLSFKGFYYRLIDMASFYFADRVMLETQSQINYCHKMFKVPIEKCILAWTGADDDKFRYDSSLKKFDKFTVIFRGALMPESGAEFAVEAANKLEKEGVDVIMVSNGMLKNKIDDLIGKLKPANLKLISDFLPDAELVSMMGRSHLSLGQLSNHERLDRTIPHKAYESLAMKLPYLTASNIAVLELLKPGETCIECKPADSNDLAGKILWAKNNYSEAERIAQKGYELYQRELKSDVLAQKLLESVKSVLV